MEVKRVYPVDDVDFYWVHPIDGVGAVFSRARVGYLIIFKRRDEVFHIRAVANRTYDWSVLIYQVNHTVHGAHSRLHESQLPGHKW